MSELIQGTDEWLLARSGKVTASRISDLMTKTRSGGYGAGRKNYMAELIVERITGKPAEHFISAPMIWGTETEPQARHAYEFYNAIEVVEVGFVDHSTISECGASPDGLIGADGLIEIKCPNTATHIETLLSEKIDAKYIKQMQFQMACTEMEWCDFVSFDPRMPENLRMFVKRVPRDKDMITEIEVEIRKFKIEMEEKIERLNKL